MRINEWYNSKFIKLARSEKEFIKKKSYNFYVKGRKINDNINLRDNGIENNDMILVCHLNKK